MFARDTGLGAFRIIGNCEPTPSAPDRLHCHYLVAFGDGVCVPGTPAPPTELVSLSTAGTPAGTGRGRPAAGLAGTSATTAGLSPFAARIDAGRLRKHIKRYLGKRPICVSHGQSDYDWAVARIKAAWPTCPASVDFNWYMQYCYWAWGHAICDVQHVRSVTDVSAYCLKYVLKRFDDGQDDYWFITHG